MTLSRPWMVVAVGVLVLFCMSPYLLDALWGNVPIVFYGRVVDESGKGVPGAVVTMDVVAMKRLSVPVPFAPNQTGWLVKAVTGQNGEFIVHGGRGTSIELIDIKKANHGLAVLTQSGGDFTYTSRINGVLPYHPDPAHPAIFRLPHLKG